MSASLSLSTSYVKKSPDGAYLVTFFFFGHPWVLKTSGASQRWMIRHGADFVWRPLRDRFSSSEHDHRQLSLEMDLPLDALEQAKRQVFRARYGCPTPTFNEQYLRNSPFTPSMV